MQPVQCLAGDVAQHDTVSSGGLVRPGLCILCAKCLFVFWRDSLVFEKLSKCSCWVECNTSTCNFALLGFFVCGCNVNAFKGASLRLSPVQMG